MFTCYMGNMQALSLIEDPLAWAQGQEGRRWVRMWGETHWCSQDPPAPEQQSTIGPRLSLQEWNTFIANL